MITTIDQLNRTLILSHFPERIISIVPSQTELLFDLGLGDRVVGITKFCIHPESWYKRKPKVGGTKKLDLDKIRSLKPDLIFANKEENSENEIRTLMNEFPVWVSNIQNLDDACKMTREIALVLNLSEKGNEIIHSISHEFDLLHRKNYKKIKFAYLIWNDPFMVAGGDTFISYILGMTGMVNVFNDSKRYPERVTKQLIEAKPDVIILSTEPFPFKKKDIKRYRDEFNNIPVVLADGELISWYGSRLIKTPSYLIKLREKINSAL
jgi:ABC-type Fe3+-hydroxamate transport system substrate-binding protein